MAARVFKELRKCRGGCELPLAVKPGTINPHADWCPYCCPVCARQAAEAPLRFAGVGRAYGGA